jgi:signal transduction histidine kinase
MALVVAVPIVRWVLRPVRDLDEAAHAVGSGKLSTHVSDRAGPPELRRLATSFNAMADSVDAAARRQREFVAQASHQLRNPLTALRLRMENAESYATDPDSREELHFALEEADRLGETVDAMLDLARAESTPDVPQSVDVSAAIRRRAQAWEVAYAHSHTALEIDAPPGMIAVCLPDLLEHGLDALLDNALKYGRGGAVDVTARSPRAGWVEIEVRDTGPGLLPDEFGHAGDRFWRSPRHQNVPGTGLGIAITRTLAEGSGGSMELAARHPHGLAVRILLPASDVLRDTSAPLPRAGREGTS